MKAKKEWWFKAAQSQIAKKQGISKERAGAIACGWCFGKPQQQPRKRIPT
jgi:hypothetical protein